MLISALKQKKIGILGFGKEGKVIYQLLKQKIDSPAISVFSDTPITALAECPVYIGADSSEPLASLDILIRSPGYPPHHPLRLKADELGLTQTTPTNIFLRELREAQLPVIGITGSKGKSTTSMLTHLMLQAAGIESLLVGNIGKVALEHLDQILTKKAVTVMELSSFQCADLETGYGPSTACILDLFPEHLDWHKNTTHYYQSKHRIATTQRPGDNLFINQQAIPLLQSTSFPAENVQIINTTTGLNFANGTFNTGNLPFHNDQNMLLKGLHNRRNALSAFALAKHHGAQTSHLKTVLSQFQGLPYRLQDEGLINNIQWINDAISTTPDSAIAALSSLELTGNSIILGGKDRGINPKDLVAYLATSKLNAVILLPETGWQLAPLLEAIPLPFPVIKVPDLPAAIEQGKRLTKGKSYCIFSPGAPSYNQYDSFEKRGEHFSQLIRNKDKA